MMKALTIFTIAGWTTPALAVIERTLKARSFSPCGPTTEQSVGWVMPRHVPHSAFVESHDGHWMAELCIEKKKVPSSAIKEELKKRCADIEAREGRKPGRKEKKDLMEEIKIDFLPRAFSKKTNVRVWINTRDNLLMVGSTSNSTNDLVIDELMQAMMATGSTPTLMNASSDISVQGEMAAWLKDKDAPKDFLLSRDLVMKEPEDGATVRYAQHNLEIAEVAQHLEMGKVPMEVGLTWSDTVEFSLSHAMQIKKIKLLDSGESARTEDDDPFDGDLILFVTQVGGMINQLLEVFEIEA